MSYTLGQLIKVLEGYDSDMILEYGFGQPHFYNENEGDIAFVPMQYVSIQSMLESVKSAIGTSRTRNVRVDLDVNTSVNAVFTCTIDEDSRCWLVNWGEAPAETLGKTMLELMLRTAIPFDDNERYEHEHE